jgi:hypothetical protein
VGIFSASAMIFHRKRRGKEPASVARPFDAETSGAFSIQVMTVPFLRHFFDQESRPAVSDRGASTPSFPRKRESSACIPARGAAFFEFAPLRIGGGKELDPRLSGK